MSASGVRSEAGPPAPDCNGSGALNSKSGFKLDLGRLRTWAVRHFPRSSWKAFRKLDRALENWVASHRRDSDWAKKQDGDDTIALAAARSVAPAWRDWIGDSDAWAARFTEYYRNLKHIPDAEIDVEVVDALEFAGRWLLTASILDECAGTHLPSDRIFVRGLAYPAGKNIRETLGLEPLTDD